MSKMKRAVLPLLLALCFAVPPASAAGTPFDDVPADAWFAEAVAWCQEKGLMNGTSERNFSPNRTMTRAMAAAVLYRLAGSPPSAPDSGFTDVPDWCAPAVAWAARNGVAAGYDAAHFGPQDPVTRQQMAVFLWRYSGKPDSSPGQPFTDADQIGSYALEAVRWARSAGAVNGYSDGRFNPRGTATRAQMAQILMNYEASRRTVPAAPAPVSELDVLCAPGGIAVTESGALLVTDTYNKAVWRIESGNCTRYAGASTAEDLYGQPEGGFQDGTLAECQFRLPWGIAPFLDGWAVSDAENGAVRLLLPAGCQTLNPGGTSLTAGSQGASSTAFQYPTGLAADGAGNLYVADTYAGTVRKITAAGVMSTFASELKDPMGLCWHGGALYVAETGANRVVRIVNGRAEAVAGTGADGLEDGPAAQAQFACPQGIASDGAGTLYVSDTANGAVRRIRNGMVDTVAAYDPEKMESCPVAPVGLAVRDGALFVCDQFSRKVYRMELG